MKNVLLYTLLVVIVATSCKSDDTNEIIQETESPNPNILLIISDDMGLDATPNYPIGSTKPNMPNLESFMANGITFSNVWANPLCSPTRASILTGKFGFRTGVSRVPSQLSSAEHILQNDMPNYKTALIGKWHLSNNVSQPITMGIDYFAGILGGGVSSYQNWSLVEDGNSSTSTVYTTTKLTDLAIDWVNNQNETWFLWLAYNAPHTPFHLPPANLHSQGNLASDQASIDANPLPYYLASLEAMDTEIGRLLQSMTEAERENTLIIFIGDNGSPTQVSQDYPNRRAKGTIYQGGINVPMAVSGKNVTRINERDNSLINATDLYNTIVEISGNTTTQNNDSKSFKNLLENTGTSTRDFAFSEISFDNNNSDYTIRSLTHKYILFSDASEALFNLADDALENTNLLDQTLSTTDTEIYNKLKSELNSILN
mgnify:CR=1 FL=1